MNYCYFPPSLLGVGNFSNSILCACSLKSPRCFICLEDRFTAEKPVAFGTALTTAADWKWLDDTHLLLTLEGEKLKVTIQASGEIEWTEETIELNSPAYTCIGIQLKKSVLNGYIQLIMKPVE